VFTRIEHRKVRSFNAQACILYKCTLIATDFSILITNQQSLQASTTSISKSHQARTSSAPIYSPIIISDTFYKFVFICISLSLTSELNMFQNTIFFALPLALLAATCSAAPRPQGNSIPGQILGVERHDLCPRGWQYRVIGACSSGFIGCAKPEDTATCSGPLRYRQTCERPEYGQYYACPSNGFYGCSPDPKVCSQLGPNPPPQPIPGVQRSDLCPQGWKWLAPKACNSGFVGCARADDTEVCNGMRVFATCNLPEYGTYKTCKNGFFGCSPNNWDPCQESNGSTPTPPAPQPPAPKPDTPTHPKCAAGTTYYTRGACSSGFTGCGRPDLCSGAQRFWWGDCPAGTGIFNVCSNGFQGCTTVSNPCS